MFTKISCAISVQKKEIPGSRALNSVVKEHEDTSLKWIASLM